MMMKYNILIATAMAGTLLTGCASDDGQLPNNGTPRTAEFSGQLRAISTRSDASNTSDASANTAWPETYESIGISATSSGTSYINQQYVATATKNGATLSVTNDGNAFYFNTTKSTESFVAYAPYTENVTNNTIAIEPLTADNAASYGYTANDADGVSTPDYIWAKTGTLTYAHNTADLTFTHVLSQLTLTVTLDESVTNRNTDGTYTVTLAGVELSHLVKTGTLSLADGTVTPGTSYGTADVTPSADETSTAGIITTKLGAYTLIPQEGIVVTVTTSAGSSYQATLPALTAGTSYAYTITVSNTGLQIKNSPIDAWETGTTSTPTVTSTYGDITDASQTRVYDLAFSDGSFMHYTDEKGNVLSLSLTSTQISAVRGIVYYKGDVTSEDTKLQTDYPKCTHGLILALQNADSECQWIGDTYVASITSAYTYESRQYNSSNIVDQQKHLGYTNTQILPNYASYVGSQSYPVEAINSYGKNTSAPKNSSGWYFPSIMELKELISVTKILDKELSTYGESLSSSGYILSSTEEVSRLSSYVMVLDVSSSYELTVPKNAQCAVRPICAY
jgi:hypothetical protein